MSMLDNFKVIEITKTTEPACVIIEDNKLRFTKPVAIELGYPAYVRILLDDADSVSQFRWRKEMRAMWSNSLRKRKARKLLSFTRML
jgi:hypothetical protein